MSICDRCGFEEKDEQANFCKYCGTFLKVPSSRDIKNNSVSAGAIAGVDFNVDTIKRTVANELSIDPELLNSAERDSVVSMARSVAIVLCHDLLPSLSLVEIGRHFHKDHSSIHEVISKFKNDYLDFEPYYTHIYLRLKRSFQKQKEGISRKVLL